MNTEWLKKRMTFRKDLIGINFFLKVSIAMSLTQTLSTYFFVLFMLTWQSLNSACERKLSVGEWFKLATTFCTLWLWLFCVRFSMLFTATTAPDVNGLLRSGIMTDSSKNIGGFFVLFQALSVTIRLNATLASVAWSLHNSMNGYSSFI